MPRFSSDTGTDAHFTRSHPKPDVYSAAKEGKAAEEVGERERSTGREHILSRRGVTCCQAARSGQLNGLALPVAGIVP